jgi:hypothetical protein
MVYFVHVSFCYIIILRPGLRFHRTNQPASRSRICDYTSYYINPPFDQSPVYQLDESMAKGSRPPIPKFEPSRAPSNALLRFCVTPAIMFAWPTGIDSSSGSTAAADGCIGACGCDTSVAIPCPGESTCAGKFCGIEGLQS